MLGHRPALDGLRGVAILLVLAGHSGVPGVGEGGETGVALFFVLSGFLITALLAEEYRDTGRIDFAAFYRRRALRLLPALFLFLAVVLAWSQLSRWGVLSMVRPSSLTDVGVTVFYVANWWIGVYNHDSGGINHMWSLGIEEQFYLVWPALLFAGLSLFGLRSRKLLAAVVALTLVSAAEGAWLYHTSSPYLRRVYYGTDTRADGILIG